MTLISSDYTINCSKNLQKIHICFYTCNNHVHFMLCFQSYHCFTPRKVSLLKMDPSATVGFYCRTRADFDKFVQNTEQVGLIEVGNCSLYTYPIIWIGEYFRFWLALKSDFFLKILINVTKLLFLLFERNWASQIEILKWLTRKPLISQKLLYFAMFIL